MENLENWVSDTTTELILETLCRTVIVVGSSRWDEQFLEFKFDDDCTLEGRIASNRDEHMSRGYGHCHLRVEEGLVSLPSLPSHAGII